MWRITRAWYGVIGAAALLLASGAGTNAEAHQPRALTEANAYLTSHVNGPVWAPTSIAGISPVPVLSARVKTTRVGYQVWLYLTPPRALPLNSELPLRYTGDAWSYGGYAAQRYLSVHSAETEIRRDATEGCLNESYSLNDSQTYLGHGVLATRIRGTDCATWRYDGATYVLESNLSATRYSIDAERLLLMTAMKFPPPHGALVVSVAAAGAATTVFWRSGREVFWVDSNHLVSVGLALAHDASLIR